MRILRLVLIAVAVGAFVGGAVAYIEVRVDRDAAPGEEVENTVLPGGLAAGSTLPGAPRVEVEKANFDFGTMQRGTTKSHDFLIRNTGEAPLELKVGPTSCKCTLGDVTDKPIQPGETTHVRLEWSAKSDSGAFRQTATIMTTDPLRRQIELTIEGQIVEASGVSPFEFSLDKIPAGESKSAHVFLMAMLQEDLTVEDAQIPQPEMQDKFDIQIEPASHDELPDPNARKGVKITLTAKPGLPIGRLHQWLSLRTNLPEAEKLEIPITGQVVGEISVRGGGGEGVWNEEAGVLNLGRVQSSEGKKARVNLLVRGKNAMDVKFDVQSVDPPELKVSIGKPQQFKETLSHVPVEIEVPRGIRPMVRLHTAQGDEARIMLSTTHPTIKEIAIPVRFSVER